MSKNSGMGRKRIDNKDSLGLGKCTLSGHAEQCGNGKLKKINFRWAGKASLSNPFCIENPLDKRCGDIPTLEREALKLEKSLKDIREKISKLNGK